MYNPAVSTVMTKDPCTVSPDTDFKTIIDLLAARRISAVPVVAGDGFPIGLVSEADLLRKQENSDLPERHSLLASKESRRRQSKAAGSRARDLMSTPVYAVGPNESLSFAAGELARRGVRRLCVLDGGKLVGVVSRRDLLGVFRRSDEDIRREIEQDVLVHALWADRDSVSVSVENGVVTILGRLERKCEVEIAGRLAVKIAGVIEVRNRLDYTWNDLPAPTGVNPVPGWIAPSLEGVGHESK